MFGTRTPKDQFLTHRDAAKQFILNCEGKQAVFLSSRDCSAAPNPLPSSSQSSHQNESTARNVIPEGLKSSYDSVSSFLSKLKSNATSLSESSCILGRYLLPSTPSDMKALGCEELDFIPSSEASEGTFVRYRLEYLENPSDKSVSYRFASFDMSSIFLLQDYLL